MGQSHYLPGHNLPLVALGGFILWLAWFGFNAGSTINAGVSVGRIALNTHLLLHVQLRLLTCCCT